jgi:rhodanese-related sulfurtransferase
MKRTRFSVTMEARTKELAGTGPGVSLPRVKDLDNDELEKLLESGVPYVDVRTPEEFLAGHIPNAYNVPVLLRSAGAGLDPNPEFVEVMGRHFPGALPLVVGCAAGARSKQARALLLRAGYTEVHNLAGGMNGGRDPFGAKLTGWAEGGKPTTTDVDPSRTYAGLKA